MTIITWTILSTNIKSKKAVIDLPVRGVAVRINHKHPEARTLPHSLRGRRTAIVVMLNAIADLREVASLYINCYTFLEGDWMSNRVT